MKHVLSEAEIDFTSFENFEAASKAVLEYLQATLGFGLWMTTRTNIPDWIVLQARDHKYGIDAGTVFNWADSYCSRMVNGDGPHIAPNALEVPAYVDAEIGKQIPIGAYIGVPMRSGDGNLLGTLCAIDPSPRQLTPDVELPRIQLCARMLSTLLDRDLAIAGLQRENLRIREDSLKDSLTNLLNRKGWNAAVIDEQARLARYGSPISVYVLDLDNLKVVNDAEGHASGDGLIQAAANCLLSTFRKSDVIARIGGDEFSVLAVEIPSAASDLLFEKVCANFRSRDIEVSVGYAIHRPGESIEQTQARADISMYEMKKARRGNE